MTASLEVDMRRLRLELQMVDKRFAAAMRREIRAAVAEVGQLDLERIRSNSHWSTGKKHGTSIADATTLRPSFTIRSAGVRISTSRKAAPHARPFEMGSAAGDKSAFVNGKGGQVKTKPFFFTSIEQMDPDTQARIRAAIDIVCVEAGFR